MKILFFILVLLVSSCSGPRWPLKPGPDDQQLTTMERSGIIETGLLDGRPWNPDSAYWRYSWTERLSFMKPPIKVISMVPVSHGVFREKWKNHVVTVIDGDGNLRSLGEVSIEYMAPGTVLTGLSRAD